MPSNRPRMACGLAPSQLKPRQTSKITQLLAFVPDSDIMMVSELSIIVQVILCTFSAAYLLLTSII